MGAVRGMALGGVDGASLAALHVASLSLEQHCCPWSGTPHTPMLWQHFRAACHRVWAFLVTLKCSSLRILSSSLAAFYMF